MKLASSSNSVTRLQSKWPAPPMRQLERERSLRPDHRGNSPLQALVRTSFPAPLIFYTLRTHRVFAGLASIQQAPWPANATRIRTARPFAVAGGTTLRAEWWRDRASARCAGAAMLNANSAHKEKRFTPVRGKTHHNQAEYFSPVWEQWRDINEWKPKKRGEVTSLGGFPFPGLGKGLKGIKLVKKDESTFWEVLQGVFFLFFSVFHVEQCESCVIYQA